MPRILHLIPGRARLKIETLKGRPDLAQWLRIHLEAVPHVNRVTVNTRTGSLLLLYDARALRSPAFLDEISAALGKLFPGRIGPGYLRIKVRRLKGKAELAHMLEARLARLRGIRRISIDPVGGYCHLDYDSKVVTSPAFLDALSDALSALLPRVKLKKLLALAGFRVR